MMRKILFVLIVFFFLNPVLLRAQDSPGRAAFIADSIAKRESFLADSLLFSPYETRIKGYFETMMDPLKVESRKDIAPKLEVTVNEMLHHKESFLWAFDSIKYIGKIYSSDSLLRIYTWNIPFADGSYNYYGFIQDTTSLIKLEQNPWAVLNEQTPCSADKWYGALYYDALARDCNGTIIYTLLGLKLDSGTTTRKFTDGLIIKGERAELGSRKMFTDGEKEYSRLIFEYSSRISMMMRYYPQHDMIVADHLSPAGPEYEGNRAYYGPDFSYDGYYFKKCMWIMKSDIDFKPIFNNLPKE